MPAKDPQKALFAALSAAQGAFGRMEKTGRNDFARYNYVPSDVIIAVAAEVLREAGLAVVPTEATFTPTPDDKKISGVYRCCWSLVHKDGGSIGMERCLPIPIDKKPADKLVLGANSELLGYLYRDLFSINRGADVDVSGRNDEFPAEPEPAHEPLEMGQKATIRNLIGDLSDALGKDIPDHDAKAFEIASAKFRRKVDGWGELTATDARALMDTLTKKLAAANAAKKDTAA